MKRIRDIIILAVKKIPDPFYAGGAAEVAFFLLLSLVPTMILLGQLLNLFALSMDAIKSLLASYLDVRMQTIILPLFDYTPSRAFSVMLIILALWSGSKALFSLMRISNYAYKGGAGYVNPVTGYIGERIRALFTIVLFLLTLIFTLYVLVFGEVFVRQALDAINDLLKQGYRFGDVWYSVRWIIAFLLYLFMVSSVYYMLPNRRRNISRLIVKGKWNTFKNLIRSWLTNSWSIYKMIFPGAFFASVAILLVTWGYSYYMVHIATGNFNLIYGGLSSIVILLIWFYVIAFVLIAGIMINAAFAERKRGSEKHE